MDGTLFDNRRRKYFTKQRTAAFALLFAAAVFLYFSPKLFLSKLELDPYNEWLEYKKEPPVEMIKIWHVVGIRPYIGSLGTWLKIRTSDYTKDLIGVYFEVSAMSYDAACEQLERGSYPDMISFSQGMFSADMFLFAAGSEYASLYPAAYCFSGRILVYDPSREMEVHSISLETAGSSEEFKKGKSSSCICDVRTAGDLQRMQLLGNCPNFEAIPIDEEPCFQYIGVTRCIDKAKLPYAIGFIEHLLDVKPQSTLCEIGLIPINGCARAEYDTEWLKALYESIKDAPIPDCFKGI